jgi:hypothetical protein
MHSRLVAEIDSALNKWLDGIPEFCLSKNRFTRLLLTLIISVRWDPLREDILLFHQSAQLQINFYALQILIHRPVLLSQSATRNSSLTSLAICTNAARATARILSEQVKREKVAIFHCMARDDYPPLFL